MKKEGGNEARIFNHSKEKVRINASCKYSWKEKHSYKYINEEKKLGKNASKK